jgi:hypothetical protein
MGGTTGKSSNGEQRFAITPDVAQRFRQQIRGLIWRWETASVCAILILFNSALTPGQYLFDLGFWSRMLVNISITAVFLGWIWVALPSALLLGLARNIPWYYIQQVFYLPVSASFVSALYFAMQPEAGLPWVAWMFLVVTVNVALATFLVTFFLENTIKTKVAETLGEVPIWHPLRRQAEPECGVQALLKPAHRGDVLHMVADNQYVRITTTAGETLLRLTLTEAVKMIEPDVGLRVHRSHWVRKTAIEALKFEKGNPRLHLNNGDIVAASRKIVPEIRTILTKPDF